MSDLASDQLVLMGVATEGWADIHGTKCRVIHHPPSVDSPDFLREGWTEWRIHVTEGDHKGRLVEAESLAEAAELLHSVLTSAKPKPRKVRPKGQTKRKLRSQRS